MTFNVTRQKLAASIKRLGADLDFSVAHRARMQRLPAEFLLRGRA
jgi:hypothetical protein